MYFVGFCCLKKNSFTYLSWDLSLNFLQRKERNAEASRTIIITIYLKKQYSLYSAVPQRNMCKKKILKKRKCVMIFQQILMSCFL